MANECAYSSPCAASPLSDGENKENRQEAGITGARSSKNEAPLLQVYVGNVYWISYYPIPGRLTPLGGLS